MDSICAERYKYILEQKKNFTLITFKVLALYQAALLAIATIQFKILEKLTSQEIDTLLAYTSSWVVYFMHMTLSVMCASLLISGMFSWVSYKKEEAYIETSYGIRRGISYASKLSFLKILRWFEFWAVLGFILINALHFFLLDNYILFIIDRHT